MIDPLPSFFDPKAFASSNPSRLKDPRVRKVFWLIPTATPVLVFTPSLAHSQKPLSKSWELKPSFFIKLSARQRAMAVSSVQAPDGKLNLPPAR